MLSKMQKKAVGLLFEKSDAEVAARLKIKQSELDAWKSDPEFVQALCDRLRENRRVASRILSRICVDACRELQALIGSDDDKNKPKAIIEVLKASGLFKDMVGGDGDYVGNLLGRLADEDAESGEED